MVKSLVEMSRKYWSRTLSGEREILGARLVPGEEWIPPQQVYSLFALVEESLLLQAPSGIEEKVRKRDKANRPPTATSPM